MPTKQRAWSPRLWREIGRNTPGATTSLIIEQLKVLCRSVFPHRAGQLVFHSAENVKWENLPEAECLRWNHALTGWGWLGRDYPTMSWSPEAELAIIRTGIWVWTRGVDGPLPKVLADGALRRRQALSKRQEALAAHAVWARVGAATLMAADRLAKVDDFMSLAGEDRAIIIEWSNIERELQWKELILPKLEKWFTRHPVVPQTIKQLWLDAWRRENK